jgi:hypothetical protein
MKGCEKQINGYDGIWTDAISNEENKWTNEGMRIENERMWWANEEMQRRNEWI